MMNNEMQVFEHSEFGRLEVLTVEDKPYFPATESARILGYNQPVHAVNRHCLEDGCMKRTVIDRLGREQEMKFISEGNLYRLIIRSKLPAAERFEKWVFDDVLPSIRKHGAYITTEMLEKILANPALAIRYFNMMKAEREKREALEERVEVLAPKARYHDIILQCNTAIPISVIAKDYGKSGAWLNNCLRELGVQYRVGDTWVLYQQYAQYGYTQTKTHNYVNPKTGEPGAKPHTYWTQKGRLFLYDILKVDGILPRIERDANAEAARDFGEADGYE